VKSSFTDIAVSSNLAALGDNRCLFIRMGEIGLGNSDSLVEKADAGPFANESKGSYFAATLKRRHFYHPTISC